MDIQSPLPGIFYRRPSPESPPFVEAGQSIHAGQTIGLVEVMKQFSEVQAEQAGVLQQFCVEDQQIVEPGQVLAIVV